MHSANKQRGAPFKRGQLSNPAGKPKGTRNRARLALEALLDGQSEILTQKAIDIALTGDIAALRLCLDRILPVRKDRSGSFEMEPTNSAEGAKAAAALLHAIVTGNLRRAL